MRLTISILAILGVIGIGALVLYLDYGTVAPCGVLRERFKAEAIHSGRLGAFVATAMPDNVLDGMLAAQYGRLSPGHCINLLVHGEPRNDGRGQ